MDNLELEISARNTLLEELKKTVPELEKLKQVSESIINTERELGKNLASQFSQAEKNIAKEVQARTKQREATDELAKVIEKVNQANKNTGAEAVKSLNTLKENEAELKKMFEELQKLDAKGKQLIANISAAADAGDAQGIQRLIQEFKEGLDPEQAKEFAKGIEEGMAKAETAISRPTRELKELKRQITSGELEGDALVRATQRAAELEDQIGDVSQRIKALSSDTFAFDATVQGFTAIAAGASIAEGTMALFGNESEDLQKSLLKVNALMAIMNGLQEVSAFITGQSAAKLALLTAAQKIYALAVGTSTGAMKTFRVALLSTGIGALIVAIGSLVANFDKIKNAINGISDEQSAQLESSTKLVEAEEKKLELMGNQDNTLRLQGLSEDEILRKKQAQTKQTILALEASIVTQETLNKTQIEAAARNRDILKGIVDFLTAPFRVIVGGIDLLLEGLNKVGAISDETYKNIGKLQDRFSNKVSNFFFDPEDTRKEGEATVQATRDKINELQNQYDGYELSLRESARRSAAERLKIQEESQKKEIENQKKFNEQMTELFKQVDDAWLESLSAEDKILAQAAMNDDMLEVQRQQYIDSLNLLNISAEERAAREQAIEEYIGELKKDSIRKTTEELTKIRAEQAANDAQQAREDLDIQMQIQIAESNKRLNLIRSTFDTEEEFTRAKEEAKLQIELEFAKKGLELLAGNLSDIQELEKAQLEERISEIESTIQQASQDQELTFVQKTDNFIMKLFGVDEEGIADTKALLAQTFGEIAKIANSALNARIQATQQVIDSISNQISAQQEAVEQQEELEKQGYASSVETEKKKLAELKAQRELAVRDQIKLRKIQAAIETGQQIGSLATAAAQMFASQAPKGLVGVALAIAAISTIFAAFNKFKAAGQASATQLRKGGTGDMQGFIRGRMHEHGGERFTDHIEVEDGERWGVLSRSASRKYGNEFVDLVTRMNQDTFKPEGYRLPAFYHIIQSPEYKDMQMNSSKDTIMYGMMREIKMLNDKVAAFMKQEGSRESVHVDGNVTVIRKGAHVKRITRTS